MMKFSMEKEKELRAKMRQMKVFEKDIEETFIKSSGPGGQNVNKVSTCVQIYHKPTRVYIKYQKERTQALNRYKARCLLLDKIQKKRKDAELKAKQLREKKRRQSRRRSKAAKEKVLESKRKRSEKKTGRRKINMSRADKY